MACLSASADWRRGLVLNGTSEYITDGDIEPDEFTLCAWIKNVGSANRESIISKGYDASNTTQPYYLRKTTGDLLELLIFDGVGFNVTSSTIDIADGEWHMVTATRAGSVVVLYVDGAQDGTSTSLNNQPNYNTLNTIIGANRLNATTIGNYFNGTIVAPLIHSRALSPAEVAGLYNMVVANTNDGVSLEVPRAWIDGTNTLVLDLDIPEVYDSGDTVAEVLDVSTNRNNGTLEPSVTAGPMWSAIDGGRYSFDGVDQYIPLIDNGSIDFDGGNEDFTFAAWVKRDLSGITEHIYDNRDANDDGYRFAIINDKVYCSVDAIDIISTSTITDTDYHLIACSVDRSGNGQIYIDGIADGSPVAIGGEVMASASSTFIGRRRYAADQYFDGRMRQLWMYASILTSQQHLDLFNGINPSIDPVLDMPFQYESYKMLNNGSAGDSATITGTPDVSGAFQVPSPHR